MPRKGERHTGLAYKMAEILRTEGPLSPGQLSKLTGATVVEVKGALRSAKRSGRIKQHNWEPIEYTEEQLANDTKPNGILYEFGKECGCYACNPKQGYALSTATW